MVSVNSFFNGALCRKQVKRFAPMWGLYTFLLLMIPFYIFIAIGPRDYGVEGSLRNVRDMLYSLGAFGGYIAGAILGLALAMAMWSYLYNHRAVSLIHSLPMTRKTIFATNYITGILFFLVPHLVAMVVTALVMLSGGIFDIQALLGCFGTLTLTVFTFYNFGTLFALITGHIVVLPVIYIVFQVLAAAVIGIFRFLFNSFVYGYTDADGGIMDMIGTWGSPLFAYAEKMDTIYTNNIGVTGIQGMEVVYIYAVVSIFFVIAAYIALSKRQMELSGEIITVNFLRPIFKFGFAVCVSIFAGTVFYMMFSGSLLDGLGGLIFFTAIWGIIGYYIGSMIMQKSLRVFKGSLRPCAIMVILVSAMLCVMEFDLTGYEKALPDPEKVISVKIDGVTVADEEYIDAVMLLHQALINEKDKVEHFDKEQDDEAVYLAHYGEEMSGDYQYPSFAQWIGYDVSNHEFAMVEYTLENGSTFARSYMFPVSVALLQRENSPAALFEALKNKGDWRAWRYFYPDTRVLEDELSPSEAVLYLYEKGEMSDEYATVKVRNFTKSQREELLNAVLEDMAAERMGTFYGLDIPEKFETKYENTIYFAFETAYNKEDDALYEDTSWYVSRNGQGEKMRSFDVSIPLELGSSSTLALLESWGITRDMLVTSADYELVRYERERSEKYGIYDKEYPEVSEETVDYAAPTTKAEEVEDYEMDISQFQNP